MQCHAIKHFALGGAAVDSASARSRYFSSGSALLQEQRTGSPRGASSKRMRLRQPPPWKTAITRRPLVLDDSCNHADLTLTLTLLPPALAPIHKPPTPQTRPLRWPAMC